jgi:glycerate-2-kinase
MLIKNYDELVKESDLRRKALEIVEAGLESLKPEKVIGEKVRLKKNFLIIQDWKGKSQKFNLSHYKKIVVVGFGKATSFLAKEIEKILDFRIKDGLVIDTTLANLKKVKAIKGTHPFSSLENIKATEKLLCLGALQEIGKLEKGVLISLNTDGKDGQSKAAGAIVDERSDQKAWQKNLNPEQFLKENNSYFFFKKLNDLIFIEPKLINIADIGVILKNNK